MKSPRLLTVFAFAALFACGVEPQCVPTQGNEPAESETFRQVPLTPVPAQDSDPSGSGNVGQVPLTPVPGAGPEMADTTAPVPITTVPPCSLWPGSDRDPCERRVPWTMPRLNAKRVIATYEMPDPMPTIREAVDSGFERPYRLPHLVVRGVVVPGSTRCASQTGRASTGIDFAGDVEWRSGSSNIRCFVDVSVREYLVGGGPARVTIVKGWINNDHLYPDFATVPRDAAYMAWVASPTVDALEGYEWIFWLQVPFDSTSETWESWKYWSVQRRLDGSVVAVDRLSGFHFEPEANADRLEIPLDRYAIEVKAARQYYDKLYGGRVSASTTSPAIIATSDRSSLSAYLRSIGTYEVEGFTPQPPPPAPVPTDPPAGLGAGLSASSQIELSWLAPSVAGVSGYKVVRRVPKGEFVTVVADTGSTETAYTDASAPMTAGVTYIYRVLALNEYGESLASNRATVELPGPDAPTDFTATNYEGDVVLTWTQPGVIMPSCYRIYRRAQGEQSFEWVVNCWSAELRSWRDDDVESGTRYIYRIVPMIGYTESGATARASVRVR